MGTHVILQDLPAERAALDFEAYAQTVADIIRNSKPQFAIGVFGGWGAGKTTLMKAIAKKLDDPPGQSSSLVKVEFSAWRYEREPNLLVPLLDVIREALAAWAVQNPGASDVVNGTVRTVGRAVKALLAGFALKIGVPNGLEASFDASKAIDTWDQQGLQAEETARSVYHACFTALGEAFAEFTREDPKRRIVVFVDDLDRCLPLGAMEVIEAMKLFFDLHGFVFVVGLDQKVIEAAVEIRYSEFNAGVGSEERKVSGEEYIKKIFQVPFSLAPVTAADVGELVASFLEEAKASSQQRNDVTRRVVPHLRYVVGAGPVNPREIKRYINAYTLTCAVRPTLSPDVILALQTLNYRQDWRRIYRSIVLYRGVLIDSLRRFVEGERGALENLDDSLAGIPPDLVEYVRDGPAHALLGVAAHQINEYIYAGEASKSTGDRALVDLARDVAALRGRLKALPGAIAHEALSSLAETKAAVSELLERLTSHTLPRATAESIREVLIFVDRQVGQAHQRVGGSKEPIEVDWAPAIARLNSVVPQLVANY